mmetsp:Transcript_771/g.2317  ORF Transcript_771/g.2317 Transcript_771/m.2317 type:complete len:392 (+) Transcript_771:123-1298(+)
MDRLLLFLAAASALVPQPPWRQRGSRRSMLLGDDRYSTWKVELEAYERLPAPLVYIDQSPGAGLGVYARDRIAAGTTITEYVGLVAPTPEARSEELELQQAFYGPDWRRYSQRYEIGLTGSAVADVGGAARGGAFGSAANTADEYCDVDETAAACRARAGEADFVLLGKVPAQGACPEEGVAQLINDHTAIRASSYESPGDGALRASDVDGFVLKDAAWPYPPVAVDGASLRAATANYVSCIESETNCALVQARAGTSGLYAPRIFAVATRDIEAGEELRLTYGAEWWLAQLRRAALAQLVTCRPAPARAAALASVIRAIERVSVETIADQARAIGRAGSMPRGFVTPLEPLPPLDDLLAPDDENWQRAILQEEFASAMECSVEDLYSDAF